MHPQRPSWGRKEGKLYFSTYGQQWGQVYAESETSFFGEDDDTRVEFVKDAAGQVTGLNLEISRMVLPARKVR